MASLAERLVQLRQQRGIRQKDIAELLGVSERAVQYYESGKRHPDFEGLIKLADYFNVSLDYLVGRSDDPQRR